MQQRWGISVGLGRRAVAFTAALAVAAGSWVGAASSAVDATPPEAAQASAAVLDAATGLRVDGLAQPADLENLTSPTFSWQLTSLPQQSAYRVVVASTAALAAADDGDVWDSGKVTSAQQADVAYDGPALAPSERYYWTVQVWDGNDTALEWAEPSWFGTSPGATWDEATPVWAPSPTPTWTDYTFTGKLTVTAVAVGIRFRAVDSNNSYMWQFRGSDNRLVPHKQTGGSYATLGSAVNLPAGTLAVGTQATVAIQVEGSTITTLINGTQVDQRTDTSYATGLVGVRTGNTETGLLDDVTVVSSSGSTLFSDDFSGDNPFVCGTIIDGALSVPVASNCLVAGYGNDWVMLRKDVQLADKEIAWASLFATGTEWRASKQYVFKAAINGTFVGLGPTAPVGTETRFDGFDVTSLLEPGETAAISLVANSSSSNARVLAQLQVQYTDGTRQVVGTGSDWQALSAGKVYPSPGSYGTGSFSAPRENLDARRFPTGYDEPGYDATGWVAAEERSAITDLQAAPMAKVEEQLREPATVTDKGNGTYLVDFGRTWMGGISWDVAAGTAGQQVQVRFGQILTDGGVKLPTSAGNNYLDTITLRDGAQHLETWGMRTFRYVEVVGAPEPVTAESLKAVALVYPFDEEASTFASSDDNLEQVYRLSKNTIEATNLNLYTDSWERERTNYEADGYLQQMSSLYLMDDLSLARYSMDYFKTNRTWPTEWPVYVILAVHDAWRQTGNTEQVAEYYENLKTKLPSEKWFESSTGLIRKTSGSNGCSSSTDCDIVDWPTSQRDGYVYRQYNTVINAISYRALVDMSAMAEALGKDEEAADYADQAAALRDAINAKFYNSGTGAYDDGADSSGALTGHYSVHASAFALAFGVPEESERAKVADFVESRGMACSVYCAAFLIKGLYDGGNGQAALDLMTSEGTSSWMNMIEAGAGATMEAWDLSQKSNTSYSHPWAASPAFNVPSGLFGIQPLTAGYERVAIKPQPGDLAWGTIKTPTVRGSVGAAFEQGAAGITVVASVPGNTRATVSVPTTATAETELAVDGVARTVVPQDGFLEVTLGAGCHVLAPTTGDDVDLDRLTSVCSVEPTTGPDLIASVSSDGGQGWYGAGAELTLTPTTETEGTTAEYRIGDGEWTSYDGPVALAAGSYDIAWRLLEGDEVIASGTLAVQVDEVNPTVSAAVDGRTVTLTAADDASGVDLVEYRIDEGDWTAYSAPFELDTAAHAVTYRATDRAGNSSPPASLDVEEAPSAPVATAPPTVTGSATYGARLTATPGTWDTDVTPSFQWLRDGSAVPGATGSTYLLGRADVGARISVRVTATAPDRPAGTATSAATAPVARASSRTAVKITPKKVRAGKKVTVVVTVTGAGARAKGKVRITRSGAKPVTRSLHSGRVRFTFTARGKGAKKVSVRYTGSDVLAPSTAKARYRVR